MHDMASAPLLKKQLLFETLAILSVFYLPFLLGGSGRYLDASLALTEIYYFLYCCAKIGLILYLVWSGGERFSKFGLVKPRPSDLFWAIPLLLLACGLQVYLTLFLETHHFYMGWSGDNGVYADMLIHTPGALVSALSTCLFWSGYLITRFEQIGTKTVLAVLLPALLAGAQHLSLSEWVSNAAIFVVTIIFGIYFVKYRRIWPLVFAQAGLIIVLEGHFYSLTHPLIRFVLNR